MNFNGKAVIISAPSGAGKTTLVRRLLSANLPLGFSVSATSRSVRPGEKDGIDYYFLTPEEFRRRITAHDFLEWEEVYDNQFYGTLKSEVERLWNKELHLIFDVDVKGGLNIKNYFADRAISIFILPPSLNVLKERLQSRGTESEESLVKRVSKADLEISFAPRFDLRIVNDNLEKSSVELYEAVTDFLRN
jgi:guanylate kinase